MKDIYFIFRREFYLVFRDHAVLTFFIFLCLGYPLIYTFIYSNEVVRQVPVAVIDQSKSPLSREFLRRSAAFHVAERNIRYFRDSGGFQ